MSTTMTSVYRYLFGSSSSSMGNHPRQSRSNDATTNSSSSSSASSTASRLQIQTQFPEDNNGSSDIEQDKAAPSETTSLLPHNEHSAAAAAAPINDDNKDNYDTSLRSPAEQSATDFYFPPNNPSIQRYYRFTSTTLTPIAALHRRPGTASTPMGNASSPGGVTGLLRRSAVVPSHGTDHATGDWILVSVGGRSGWARTQSPRAPQGGFVAADTFGATEAWMGNHFFVCGG